MNSNIKTVRYFDNTRIAAFKTCPRKYFLRHRLHIRSQGTSPALVFGSSWHEAMDVVWGLCKHKAKSEVHALALEAFNRKWVEEGMTPWEDMMIEDIDQLAPRTPAVASEMLKNYIEQRYDFIRHQIDVLTIEQPIAVDVGIPDILYVGRLDKVFEKDGNIYVGEHKTTTAYKKDGGFRNDYLESWSPNSQIDGYTHAACMLYDYEKVKGVWVDAALVHKQHHNRFKFIPVNRTKEMLQSWLLDLGYWINAILAEEDRHDRIKNSINKNNFDYNTMRSFPKNTESCSHYAGCSYRDLCKFKANPDDGQIPGGFIEDKWEPFNVLNLEKINLQPEKDV